MVFALTIKRQGDGFQREVWQPNIQTGGQSAREDLEARKRRFESSLFSSSRAIFLLACILLEWALISDAVEEPAKAKYRQTWTGQPCVYWWQTMETGSCNGQRKTSTCCIPTRRLQTKDGDKQVSIANQGRSRGEDNLQCTYKGSNMWIGGAHWMIKEFAPLLCSTYHVSIHSKLMEPDLSSFRRLSFKRVVVFEKEGIKRSLSSLSCSLLSKRRSRLSAECRAGSFRWSRLMSSVPFKCFDCTMKKERSKDKRKKRNGTLFFLNCWRKIYTVSISAIGRLLLGNPAVFSGQTTRTVGCLVGYSMNGTFVDERLCCCIWSFQSSLFSVKENPCPDYDLLIRDKQNYTKIAIRIGKWTKPFHLLIHGSL